MSSRYYLTATFPIACADESTLRARVEGLEHEGLLRIESLDTIQDSSDEHVTHCSVQASLYGPGHGLWPDWMDRIQGALSPLVCGGGRLSAFNQDMSADQEGCRHDVFLGRPGTADATLAQLEATLDEVETSLRMLIGNEHWASFSESLRELVASRQAEAQNERLRHPSHTG